ncbi:MAG: DUF5106 domain-containing protein [Saprospiraceae bacterium]
MKRLFFHHTDLCNFPIQNITFRSQLKFGVSLCSFFLVSFLMPAQDAGYQIEVEIAEYSGDTVFLGYRRGEKVYSRDTVAINKEGKFVFQGENELQPGIYLILLPPDNKFFDFVVTRGDQHFSVSTKAPEFFKNQKFKGSEENRLLYDYQVFMNEQVQLAKKIDEEIAAATDEKKKKKLEKQKADVTEGVKAYQGDIMKKHPTSYVAKLVAAFKEPDIPEAPLKEDGTKDERFAFRYYKAHYWDGFDLSDDIFVNTPFLLQKIDRYINDLTQQSPDSLIEAVDYILERAEKNKTVFQIVLPHLTNKYYKPEIMGLDKVFVHIADKYYATGKADWVSEENRKKITDDAYMNNLVLLGRPAPDVKVQLYDPEKEEFTTELMSPYDVDAEFTLVFLWKPGCGHCKAMTDKLKPFYEEWKDKGVEVFSISSANHADLEKAIKDIKAKEMPWIITADPYSRARAMINYYGTSLPRLYVLDKDKKIIANRIGVEQLPKIFEEYKKSQELDK